MLCAARTTLFAATGRFSDGAPPGGEYGASSACAWSLAPGYAYVRLNFTRFATEEGFDYVTVLAVHDDGGTELLQKLSGSPLQVRLAPRTQLCLRAAPCALRSKSSGALQVPFSLVVPAARALVVFTSDEAVQAAGFEATWDPGPFCAPSTTLIAVSGTFSDGAPPGVPYRSRPARSAG